MEIKKSALEPIVAPVNSSDEVERVSINKKFQGGLDILAKHANHAEHLLGPLQAVKDYGRVE